MAHLNCRSKMVRTMAEYAQHRDAGAINFAAGRTGRTKSSSVVLAKVAFLGESRILADMSTSTGCGLLSLAASLFASLLNSASKVARKGLRDIGLLPALAEVGRAGEGVAGEPVLERKGLFEERLSVRPGEGRRSADKGWLSVGFLFVTANAGETSDKGDLPGIDGSAIMMAPMLEPCCVAQSTEETGEPRGIAAALLRPAARNH